MNKRYQTPDERKEEQRLRKALNFAALTKEDWRNVEKWLATCGVPRARELVEEVLARRVAAHSCTGSLRAEHEPYRDWLEQDEATRLARTINWDIATALPPLKTSHSAEQLAEAAARTAEWARSLNWANVEAAIRENKQATSRRPRLPPSEPSEPKASPCPACGGSPNSDMAQRYQVVCTWCGTTGPHCHVMLLDNPAAARSDAIRLWNRLPRDEATTHEPWQFPRL